ncbi:hypothetical protein Peur_073716 [Populus x canadensis]
MVSESLGHLFLVSFPAQGHVNPLLRLGKILASKGFLVTFSSTEITGKQMRQASDIIDKLTPFGDGFIRFEFFEDGLEEDENRHQDLDQYLLQLELVGKQVIPQMIKKNAEQGRPVSCLINNPFIPWVTDVATSLGLPSAMLWVQSCACFASYYHYYHGTVPFPDEEHPEIDVQLPWMPLLKHDEVPSYLYPTTPYPFLRRAILGQYKNLDKPFCILMETFEELEPELIKHMSEIFPIRAVGPLFRNSEAPKTTVGVRMSRGEAENKLITRDEIEKCLLEAAVGPKAVEMKQNAMKWKEAAAAAVAEGGSSDLNIRSFSDDIVKAKESEIARKCIGSNEFPVSVVVKSNEKVDELLSEQVFRSLARMLSEATVGPEAVEMKQNALKLKKADETAVAEGGFSDSNIQSSVDEVK